MSVYASLILLVLVFFTILCIYHISFASFLQVIVRVYVRYSLLNMLPPPIQILYRKHSQIYVHIFYMSTSALKTRNTCVFKYIPKLNIYERNLKLNSWISEYAEFWGKWMNKNAYGSITPNRIYDNW